MATAPAAAPNALISALRAGTAGLPANAMSTYSFMPNIAPTYGPVTPRAPRTPALMPMSPMGPMPRPAPAPAPAPIAPSPVSPAPTPISSPPPSMFVPPVTQLPRIDVVPDDGFVGPMPDDFVGPMPDDFVGPMPDDVVGPMPEEPVAQTSPVAEQPTIQATDLPTLDAFEPVELPRFFNPESTRSVLKPSVTVNEGLDVTVGPAPYTDPADDFEIDRELGLVQQSDVFMGPTQQAASEPEMNSFFTPTNSISNASLNYLGTPEQEMQLGMLLEPSAWTMPEPDLSVGLPAAVPAPAAAPAPAAPQPLTEQDLFEMALFEMLSQQLLTRGAPGMTDEETFER